jgi:hypothetical protein
MLGDMRLGGWLTGCPMDDIEITIDVKGTTVTVRRWRR